MIRRHVALSCEKIQDQAKLNQKLPNQYQLHQNHFFQMLLRFR